MSFFERTSVCYGYMHTLSHGLNPSLDKWVRWQANCLSPGCHNRQVVEDDVIIGLTLQSIHCHYMPRMFCDSKHQCNSGSRMHSINNYCRDHWLCLRWLCLGKLLHERFGNIACSTILKVTMTILQAINYEAQAMNNVVYILDLKTLSNSKMKTHTHEFSFQIHLLVGDTVK